MLNVATLGPKNFALSANFTLFLFNRSLILKIPFNFGLRGSRKKTKEERCNSCIHVISDGDSAVDNRIFGAQKTVDNMRAQEQIQRQKNRRISFCASY